MLFLLTMIHVVAAVFGLLSGYLAISLRKGSGWHAAAGTLFTVSMIAMSSSAAAMSAFLVINLLNTVVALLTLYLVTTAWRTARRKEIVPDRYDVLSMVLVLAVGCGGIALGLVAAGTPKNSLHGMHASLFFVFGSIALLHGLSDLRMMRRGGLRGTARLVRHLWRMSFALLIATLSFYPGQGRLLPSWIRETNIAFIPHLLLIGTIAFWLVRVRRMKSKPAPAGDPAKTTDRALGPLPETVAARG